MARKSTTTTTTAAVPAVPAAAVPAVPAVPAAAPALTVPPPTRRALHVVRVEVSSIVWATDGYPANEMEFKRRVWQLYKADPTLVQRLVAATVGLQSVNNAPIWVVRGLYKSFIIDVLRKLIRYHYQSSAQN